MDVFRGTISNMKIRIDNKTILYFILLIVAGSGFFFTIFLPSPEGFYAFIAVASFAGFCVSLNIYDTKKQGKQLVCPTGSDCNIVVNSKYSKFFGVSLEKWGMAYFAFITLAYLGLFFVRDIFTGPSVTIIVLFSIAAGLFSSYLLFVQAFMLRAWCIWCILTALISLSICVTSLVSNTGAILFIQDIEGVLLMLKFFGFTLGVGGATSSVFLFGHFLEDASIDEKELVSLKGIFELVWVGFGLVLMSQFSLFVAYRDVMVNSGPFVAQIVSLLVFAFAAAVLMIIYAPFLIFVPFKKVSPEDSQATFRTLRHPTIVFGGVALVSWYFAFVMNFIDEVSFSILTVIFLAILLFVALFASLWDKSLHGSEHAVRTAKK